MVLPRRLGVYLRGRNGSLEGHVLQTRKKGEEEYWEDVEEEGVGDIA